MAGNDHLSNEDIVLNEFATLVELKAMARLARNGIYSPSDNERRKECLVVTRLAVQELLKDL